MGYRYSVWFSGGKGYHIYLYHDLIDSPDLPHSHKRFIETLGIECDLSLYQHGRIFSLPGRKHPKTGVQKYCVKKVPGKKIDLDIVPAPPKPVFDFKSSDRDILVRAMFRATDLASKGPPMGNRHTSIWGTAKDFAESGLPFDIVVGLMQHINSTWDNCKTEGEVVAACEQAFGYLGR